MAREQEFRKRQREEREESERQENALEAQADQVRQLVDKALPMMELVDNQYRMWVAGVDRLPPNEKRRVLDQMMFQIQNLNKPTTTLRFQCEQLRTRYVTMKERWDRQIKDVENGRIRRPAGR